MKRLGLGLLILVAACRAATTNGGNESSASTTGPAPATPTTFVDSAYGATGAASGTDSGSVPEFAFSPSGRAVVVHTQAPAISVRALLADGTADAASGTNGEVSLALPDTASVATHAITEDDGTIVVYGARQTTDGDLRAFVARIKDGAFDTGFATDGVMDLDGSEARVDSLAATHDASGAVTGYYATILHALAADDSPQDYAELLHFDASGTVDSNFVGITFDATDAILDHFPVTINANNLPTVVHGSACTIYRFTATGDGDPDFGTAGVVQGPAGIGCNAFERADGGMTVAITSADAVSLEPLTSAGVFGAPIGSLPRPPLTILASVGADGTMFVDQQGATLFDFNLLRLKPDGTMDSSFPSMPALLSGIRMLASGDTMIGSYVPTFGADAVTYAWSVQRLFATAQPVEVVDAGTLDASPVDVDSGTDAAPPDAGPVYPPYPDSNDTTDDTQTDDSYYASDAGVTGTSHVNIGSPTLGCSSAPGKSTAGAPWLVLALAALATRRRRASV